MFVQSGLELPRHRLMFARVRARLDLVFRQLHGHDRRFSPTHHRQPAAGRAGEVERSDRRRVDQDAAAGEPMARVNRHPADLPALVVEQEVLDRADAAVMRLDGASEETCHGKQHGPLFLMITPQWLHRAGSGGGKPALRSIVSELAGFVIRSKGRREALTGFE
jgi:hypothetical protein